MQGYEHLALWLRWGRIEADHVFSHTYWEKPKPTTLDKVLRLSAFQTERFTSSEETNSTAHSLLAGEEGVVLRRRESINEKKNLIVKIKMKIKLFTFPFTLHRRNAYVLRAYLIKSHNFLKFQFNNFSNFSTFFGKCNHTKPLNHIIPSKLFY